MRTLACPSCRSSLQLPDDAVGRSWRCPRCSRTTRLRASAPILATTTAAPASTPAVPALTRPTPRPYGIFLTTAPPGAEPSVGGLDISSTGRRWLFPTLVAFLAGCVFGAGVAALVLSCLGSMP